MALTPYCTATQLDQIWSDYGVTLRADDYEDNQRDDGILDAVIEKATADVNLYLLQRYSVAILADNTWVKWATAYIAAVALGRRRGNGVPQPLLEEMERYIEALKQIQAGTIELPGDSGIVTPTFDQLPSVSNMTIDSRFGRNNVRRVERTSTGKRAGAGVKQNDAIDPVTFYG
jgi:phage gp36-like protein